MFLVQLAALALHRAGASDLPETETEWLQVLRGLTPDFPHDEPWRLVVDDWSKPAFLQPPVPAGVKIEEPVTTPDALDLLITSRNHDLKRGVARTASTDDWIYALMCLQTMAPSGGGAGGYRQIARIKSGFSFRPFAGLAPLRPLHQGTCARLGAAFQRDVRVLLATREDQLREHDIYKKCGGIGLLWTSVWENGRPLQLGELDIWFIEISRRIRLGFDGEKIVGKKGTAKGSRVAAEQFSGSIGDPWAPIHRTKNEMFTLGAREGFNYKLISDLFIKGEDWVVPVLAKHSAIDDEKGTFALAIYAFSHDHNGNSRGFKSRILPIGGKISRALSLDPKREKLHELATKQIKEIEVFHEALRHSLALLAAGGDKEKCDKDRREKKKFYPRAAEAKTRFDRAADEIFFEHLWARYEAQEESAEALKSEAERFAHVLFDRASTVFEAALSGIPCPRLFRPRAEARARSKFRSLVRFAFPELFPSPTNQEDNHAIA
jgi:CRISPR system Cascade subunit CasA